MSQPTPTSSSSHRLVAAAAARRRHPSDLATILLPEATPHAGVLARIERPLRHSASTDSVSDLDRRGRLFERGSRVPTGKNSSGSSPMHRALSIHRVSLGSRLNVGSIMATPDVKTPVLP